MNKIYVNITNKCQYDCPFCCMYSSPLNKTFMAFDTFKNIVDNADKPTIVQLEGGEPLLHPHIMLFIEYCASVENVQSIVIDTNGVLLAKMVDKIIEIASRTHKNITIKPSINFYILQKRPKCIEEYQNLASACEFLEYVNFEFNIRWFNETDKTQIDECIKDLITKPYFAFNMFQFNRYGKCRLENSLPEIKINDVYSNWNIFSTDGTCFGTDLIARSEYEKTFIK